MVCVLRFIFTLMGVLVMFTGCSSDSKKLNVPKGHTLQADGRYGSSYQAFLKRPDYLETRDVWYHDGRIARAHARNSKIMVHLGIQRGVLWVEDKVAMDFPVCTGRSSHETPRGKYSIIQKEEEYRSHTYGCVLDADGRCVNADATSAAPVPPGGKFEGAKMPMWMRIYKGYGLHVGRVYRDADSHGCVRVPKEPCRILFDRCGLGTPVIIGD